MIVEFLLSEPISLPALTKRPGIHVAISDGCHGDDGPPE